MLHIHKTNRLPFNRVTPTRSLEWTDLVGSDLCRARTTRKERIIR